MFIVVEDLDRLGDLGDLRWGAADLVEDGPGFELGEHALVRLAEPGVEAVALLLPLRLVLTLLEF